MSFIRKLPFPLSQRVGSASAAQYNPQGRQYDVAIGGVPFILATMNDLPQGMETIKVRKDQFDTEDPGEQSLTGYWRRSQATFHEGAGNLYQESSTQTVAGNGFYKSSGVDVFTQGQLTLLKKMKQATVTGALYTHIRSYAVNSVRTNLCTNPSFETNTTGWSATDDGNVPTQPTLTRDTTKSFSRTASCRVNYTGDNGTGFPPQVNFTVTGLGASVAFAASVYVWVPTGSPNVVLLDATGHVGTTNGTLKDQWVRLTLNGTTSAGGVATLSIWASTPPTNADLYWFDAALIETGSVIGDYFDGNSANCVWTGTVDGSTSTRTVSASSASFCAVADGQLHTASAASGSYASMHAPAGKIIVDGLVTGTLTFYDIASDGTLYQGVTSSPGTATTWPCGGTPTRLGWGKYRLWIIGGRNIWQPDLSLVGGTAQPALFTNPNQGWTYTCMAEGPSAMYFGGHDGSTSSIHAVGLDAGGGLPTLSGTVVSTVLPDGELVQEIDVVAGQFMGIGTNRGFRVGVIGADGSVTYGPLLFEPDLVQACTSVQAHGKFFLAAFSTSSGSAFAYRIDTSTQLSDGVFAYAADVDCLFTGAITSIVGNGKLVAVTASDGRVWYQSSTEYVDTGYIQSGRIRYRTTEPKSFRFYGLEVEPLNGTVAMSVIKDDGSTVPLGTVSIQGSTFTDQFLYSGDPMKYASVRLDFTPTANKLTSPVLNSFLVRSLPAAKPQRLITLPLLCFDREQARGGQKYGGTNWAKNRYNSLLALEDAGIVVNFQDFRGLYGNHQVVIEGIRFTETTPPVGASDNGGTLLVELRTVDA